MNRKKPKKFLIKISLVIIIGIVFLHTKAIHAADEQTPAATTQTAAVSSSQKFQYTLLESLPGFFQAKTTQTELPTLILAIYKFGIWTIGIAGLFMITIGGIMYTGSAGNTSTANTAKGIIKDALLGIFAAMGAYLFLYVINPDLTKININFSQIIITEPPEVSAESAGTLQGGVAGTCNGLATQSIVNKQCSDVSSQLSGMLGCLANKLPSAIITSISDSKGYANCAPGNWNSACAHAQYSCHYGGKNCYSSGKSYAVDFSTRNLSAGQLMEAAKACGASYTKDESRTANHVHASVGQAAGCGCN